MRVLTEVMSIDLCVTYTVAKTKSGVNDAMARNIYENAISNLLAD